MKLIRNLFLAALFLLAITFSLKNSQDVSINYYYLEEAIVSPAYLLVMLSAVFGLLIGGVGGFIEKMRSGSIIKKLKKDLASKEEELTSLRNLPITESNDTVNETKTEDAAVNET